MNALQVENLSGWAGAVDEGLLQMVAESREAVDELGTDMRDTMRSLAPYDDDRASFGKGDGSKRSRKARRHARSSINKRWERDAEGEFLSVGATLKGFYLTFHEWGTSLRPAHPWARPAIEQAIGRWLGKS